REVVEVPVVTTGFVPVVVSAGRGSGPERPKPEPVYWGFGGQLRPDAWKPDSKDDQKSPPTNASLPCSTYTSRVGVLVVGASGTGGAAAEALARRGASVFVVDMRGPGRGASRASAGILAPYTEALASSRLLSLGVRSLEMYDDFVARLNDGQKGQPVEY